VRFRLDWYVRDLVYSSRMLRQQEICVNYISVSSKRILSRGHSILLLYPSASRIPMFGVQRPRPCLLRVTESPEMSRDDHHWRWVHYSHDLRLALVGRLGNVCAMWVVPSVWIRWPYLVLRITELAFCSTMRIGDQATRFLVAQGLILRC
jgi:hypothetical protein